MTCRAKASGDLILETGNQERRRTHPRELEDSHAGQRFTDDDMARYGRQASARGFCARRDEVDGDGKSRDGGALRMRVPFLFGPERDAAQTCCDCRVFKVDLVPLEKAARHVLAIESGTEELGGATAVMLKPVVDPDIAVLAAVQAADGTPHRRRRFPVHEVESLTLEFDEGVSLVDADLGNSSFEPSRLESSGSKSRKSDGSLGKMTYSERRGRSRGGSFPAIAVRLSQPLRLV